MQKREAPRNLLKATPNDQSKKKLRMSSCSKVKIKQKRRSPYFYERNAKNIGVRINGKLSLTAIFFRPNFAALKRWLNRL
jgi:hypothetical protein